MGVETAMLAAGVATNVVGSGYSFIQANKQRQLQAEAEAEAAKALAAAKKELDVNYYDQLAIAKEPYNLMRQAALTSSAQAIQAGRESERGGVATAGRIEMANQDMQQKIQAAQAEDMYNLNKLSAQEDARLAGAKSTIDLKEAEGAQKAAAQAELLRQMYAKQGVQQAGQALSSFVGDKDMVGLYANLFPGKQANTGGSYQDALTQAQNSFNSIPEIPGRGETILDKSWMDLIQPNMGPDYTPYTYNPFDVTFKK